MFKKGKKKSKDESASKFESRQQIAKSEAVDFNMNWNAGEAREQVDGFDENGFVSLKPEHTPALVGPKQPCQVTILIILYRFFCFGVWRLISMSCDLSTNLLQGLKPVKEKKVFHNSQAY